MPVIPGDDHRITKDIEGILYHTDFSRSTDLKASLARKLFSEGFSEGISERFSKGVSEEFSDGISEGADSLKKGPAPISDEEAEFVSAAVGLPAMDPWFK